MKSRIRRASMLLALGLAVALHLPADLPAQATDPGIVFVSMRDGIEDIYIMDADGSNARRITVTEPVEGEQRGSWVPAWAPDASRIAFASNRDDGGSANLYVVDADGSNLERLTKHSAFDYTPDWSPDGTRIAFMSNRDGPPEVYVMNADGTDVHRITRLEKGPSALCCPDWSPDGERIAFQATPGDSINPAGPSFHIYTMNADGSELRSLGPGGLPRWSPDGQWIALVGAGMQAHVMRPDGSDTRRVTDVDGWAMYPVWSPGGDMLAFSILPLERDVEKRIAGGEVYSVKLDGTNLTRLTENESMDGHAYWW